MTQPTIEEQERRMEEFEARINAGSDAGHDNARDAHKASPTEDNTMTDWKLKVSRSPSDLWHDNNGYHPPNGGLASNMTLRDHFAGQALGNPEICTGHERLAVLLDWFGSRGVNKYEIVSRQSLEFADAMLQARKTTGEGE